MTALYDELSGAAEFAVRLPCVDVFDVICLSEAPQQEDLPAVQSGDGLGCGP